MPKSHFAPKKYFLAEKIFRRKNFWQKIVSIDKMFLKIKEYSDKTRRKILTKLSKIRWFNEIVKWGINFSGYRQNVSDDTDQWTIISRKFFIRNWLTRMNFTVPRNNNPIFSTIKNYENFRRKFVVLIFGTIFLA